MVQGGVDHTITDRLCNHLLGLLKTLQSKLLLDIRNRYARVGNVDLLEAKLEDAVLKPVDEGQVSVSLEKLGILDAKVFEPLHVTRLNTAHDREIRSQGLLVISVREDLPVRNFSH